MTFFSSNVKDIHSVLEITVYDEDKDHKVEFLGKVAIPLLRIRNNEKKWYALKDKKLRGRAKGNSPQILLEMNIVWNKVTKFFPANTSPSIRIPQTSYRLILLTDSRLYPHFESQRREVHANRDKIQEANIRT